MQDYHQSKRDGFLNQEEAMSPHDKAHAYDQIQSFFHNAQDVFYRTDHEGRVIKVSPSVRNLLGLKPEEVIGQFVADYYVNPDQRAHFLETLQTSGGNVLGYEAEVRRHDGSSVWVSTNAYFYRNNDGDIAGVEGCIRDITRKIKTQNELQFLYSVLDQAGESILIINEEADLVYVNRAACDILGYSKEEMLRLKVFDIDPEFPPDLWPAHWQDILSRKAFTLSSIHQTREGLRFPVEVTVNAIHYQNEVFNCAFARDVSDIRSMEAQVRQSQKMQSLGVVVGGVAHDFNNILAGILGNVHLAKGDQKRQKDLLPRLEVIEKLSNRASGIVKQMLTFAKQDTVAFKLVCLNEVISSTYELAHSILPSSITSHCYIEPEKLWIYGDKTQLQQVLVHLLNNAKDATETTENPEIFISLRPFNARKKFLDRHPQAQHTQYALLSVSDNGCGIEEKLLENIFEPFFTTKHVGKGTGLGLSMTYGAVERHHGLIEVSSGKNKITEFRIYLPLTDPANH